MTPSLANFIKRFFSHYLPVHKGLAANTIMAYRDAIKLLLRYASDTRKKNAEQLQVEDLDESLVLDFLDHLETTRGCNPKTRNARLAAIRALFAFMAREEPALLLHSQTIHTIPSNARSTKRSTISKKRKCKRCLTRSASPRVPEYGIKPCCSCSTIPEPESAKSWN